MSGRERFLIDILSKYLKVPYIWGGADPEKGLDCSGLVQLILEKLNLDPPGDQTAHTLYNYFSTRGEIIERNKRKFYADEFVFTDWASIAHYYEELEQTNINSLEDLLLFI